MKGEVLIDFVSVKHENEIIIRLLFIKVFWVAKTFAKEPSDSIDKKSCWEI